MLVSQERTRPVRLLEIIATDRERCFRGAFPSTNDRKALLAEIGVEDRDERGRRRLEEPSRRNVPSRESTVRGNANQCFAVGQEPEGCGQMPIVKRVAAPTSTGLQIPDRDIPCFIAGGGESLRRVQR